jgi:hypothetical protein
MISQGDVRRKRGRAQAARRLQSPWGMKAFAVVVAAFLFGWLFAVIVIASVILEWSVEMVLLQPGWHWREPST